MCEYNAAVNVRCSLVVCRTVMHVFSYVRMFDISLRICDVCVCGSVALLAATIMWTADFKEFLIWYSLYAILFCKSWF